MKPQLQAQAAAVREAVDGTPTIEDGMICYDIINPSDACTFLAPDRDIALATLALLGEGDYGGRPLTRDGERVTEEDRAKLEVPIFLFTGSYEAWWTANGWSEEPIEKILTARKPEVSEALRSCAYGDLEDRRTYESACAAITDPERLAKFKADWEDRRRSSMNRIVNRAWLLADRLSAAA